MSNKSLDYPNSAPSQTSDVLEELSKITGIALRKRVADESPPPPPVTTKRKTAYKMGHWTCATCSADNSEAVGNRCSACGTRSARLEKRDSIASKSNSSLQSLTIDELVGNLEGLEFDVNVDTYNSNAQLQPSSMNDSFGDSSSTRFAQGNWSLRDLEKWSCSMCTYSNEPLFCACEMCGTGRPPARASSSLREETKGVATTIRAQQEQRMSELLQFRKPVAAGAMGGGAPVPLSSISSALPPLNATLAKLAIGTTTKTGLRGSAKGKSRTNARRAAGGGGMDTSLQAQEFSADVSKPHQRRSYNPDDSNGTATTFDMSSSIRMDDSWYTTNTEQQQQIAISPRIAEEEDAAC